jgi:hypothetical protein
MKSFLFGVSLLAAFAVSTPAQAESHRATHKHVAAVRHTAHHQGAATSRTTASTPAQDHTPKVPVSGDGMQSEFDRTGNT